MLILLVSLSAFPSASVAALINYDSGANTWGVADWGPYPSSGSGAFAPSSFTGYTSTNGVAMLRNDNQNGWWIGDVQVSTYSSFYAPDSLLLTVTGATWGGIVDYFTSQSTGSNFYAAMDNSVDMIDATGLSIGDLINGDFSWSGNVANIQLNYSANAVNAAIPVPATMALFGLGLVGLGWSRRKN
jgi:hypothetical protein